MKIQNLLETAKCQCSHNEVASYIVYCQGIQYLKHSVSSDSGYLGSVRSAVSGAFLQVDGELCWALPGAGASEERQVALQVRLAGRPDGDAGQAPLLPRLAVPVRKCNEPLMPVTPASDVRRLNVPLLDERP